jgi:hypothetical protein
MLSAWLGIRESVAYLVTIQSPTCVSSPLQSLRPGIKPKLEALKTLYEGKKIIVGRDKLDIVRGVLHKVWKPVLPRISSI